MALTDRCTPEAVEGKEEEEEEEKVKKKEEESGVKGEVTMDPLLDSPISLPHQQQCYYVGVLVGKLEGVLDVESIVGCCKLQEEEEEEEE